MYTYIQSEPRLWTVGRDAPGGWDSVSDHGSPQEAALACARLNHEPWIAMIDNLAARVATLEARLAEVRS